MWQSPFGGGRLLRNDGPSGFTDVAQTQWLTPEGSTSRIVFDDYDGDGDLDLLTAEFSPTVGLQFGQPQPINRLYLNDGSGNFSDVTATRMPNFPQRNTGLAVGDIDGDGDTDIVFSREYHSSSLPGAVRVFVQNAAGVAVEAAGLVPTLTGPYPSFYDVVLSDHDLDGDLDLAAASSGGLHLYSNSGAGVFTLTNTIVEPMLSKLHPVDFDGDGRMDLLGLRHDRWELMWLPMRHWQNLPAGFVDSTAILLEDAAIAPDAVHVFDCDGDGDVDLWGGTVPQSVLWHNDGQVRLLQLALRDLSGDARDFASIDFAVTGDAEGDGDLDALIVEPSRQGGSVSFVISDGNGPGPVRTVLLSADSTREPRCAAFVDVDFDGDLDVYIGIQGSGGAGQNPQELLFHNNAGVFVDVTQTQRPVDANHTNDVVFGDLDGNGAADAIVGVEVTGGRLYMGDGVGGFTNASNLLPQVAQGVTSSALLDYDLDGDLDIVQALGSGPNSATGLRLLRNDWPLPFVDVTTTQLPPLVARGVTTFDSDRDGRLDLVVGDVASGLRIFRSVGTGLVDETAIRIATGSGWAWTSYTVVDADGDGWRDLFCSSEQFSAHETYRNTNGVLVPFPAFTFFPSSNVPRRPALADFDRDGDVDLLTTDGSVKNRIRDLHDAVPPRLGLHAELVLHAHAGDGTNVQLASLMYSPVRLSPPLPLPGLGLLQIDPATTVFHSWSVIAATGGESTVRYLVPLQPALLGSSLFAQALFVHQPNPSTWRLSNLVELRVRM